MLKALIILLTIHAFFAWTKIDQCIARTHTQPESQNRCSLCEYSLLNKSTGDCDNISNKLVKFCRFYSKQNTEIFCIECELGYYLNIDQNRCEKCQVEHCAVCRKSNKCFGCFGSLFLDSKSNTCVNEKQCNIENCNVCFQDSLHSSCRVCKSGYSLNNLNEKKCILSVKNCYILDPLNSQKCFECNAGSVISEAGSCEIQTKTWNFWELIIIFTIGIVMIILIVKNPRKRNESGDDYLAVENEGIVVTNEVQA